MNTTHHELRNRRGHSMMEMVIVMSILAGMAAMSWPMLKSPLSKMRLQAAAQEVSTELAKARLKAMQSGVAQVFRIQMHTGKFQVMAASDDESTDESKPSAAEQLEAETSQTSAEERSPLTEVSDLMPEEKELPDGICFEVTVNDDVPTIERSEAADDEEVWTELAVFYPNGDTTNAVVSLRGEPDLRLDVKLSSLTGIAKIGETHRQELR